MSIYGPLTDRARHLQDLLAGALVRGLSQDDMEWLCRELNREHLSALWNRELYDPGEWRARLSLHSQALLRRRRGEE